MSPGPLSPVWGLSGTPGDSLPFARTSRVADGTMMPSLGCCGGEGDGKAFRRRHQQRKLQMLSFWRDGIERQLAALNAAISTLEAQMARDSAGEAP